MVAPLRAFAPAHVGEFDFSPVIGLSADVVLRQSIDSIGRTLAQTRYDRVSRMPPVPPRGAADHELTALESALGAELPADYRTLLSRFRYIRIDDGFSIYGFDWEGVTTGGPWISARHPVQGRALVFGDYWRFADGDQLLQLIDVAGQPVVAYLHEHGPSVEFFAPSVLLALWRMANE